MQSNQQTASSQAPRQDKVDDKLREKPLLESVTRAIAAAPLEMEPFGHIRLEGIFPDGVFDQIVSNLPPHDFYAEQMHKDAMMADGHSTRLRFELERDNVARLPSALRDFWNDVITNFESKELENAFKRKFAPVLQSRFGRDPDDVDVEQRLVLFRDLPGYKISVHPDNDDKVITAQFYLPTSAAQSHIGTSFHQRGETGELEKVKTLAFTPNSGYSFAVTADSWHSVVPLTEADGPRNSLMAIFYQRRGMRKLKGSLRKIFSLKGR